MWPLAFILAPFVLCAFAFWCCCCVGAERDDHEGGASLPKRES